MGISYILLRSPYVQTALVKYVTERIEQVTGVKMQDWRRGVPADEFFGAERCAAQGF